MEHKSTSLFTVYTQRLAGYLMQRGFVLIDLATNRNGKKVFLFTNSSALHDAIDGWMLEKAQQEYHNMETQDGCHSQTQTI